MTQIMKVTFDIDDHFREDENDTNEELGRRIEMLRNTFAIAFNATVTNEIHGGQGSLFVTYDVTVAPEEQFRVPYIREILEWLTTTKVEATEG
jgi:hypothetical protein